MKRLRDAVYGFAVGDALGVPFEFKSRGSFECCGMIGGGTWGEPDGTWSDDTSMLIATMDSIRVMGCIEPEDMMLRYRNWYERAEYTCNGDVFDIGMTTRSAIKRYMDGVPAILCGASDERSNGNGSLMRILPLAFTAASDEEINAVSALTHAHDLSKLCCRQYVAVARHLLETGALPQEWTERMRNTPREAVRSTGFVLDSLTAAIWCIVHTDCYEQAVLTAVNLGEDTDTIGALTGGLAGILYGYEDIPEEWLGRLRNRAAIEACMF